MTDRCKTSELFSDLDLSWFWRQKPFEIIESRKKLCFTFDPSLSLLSLFLSLSLSKLPPAPYLQCYLSLLKQRSCVLILQIRFHFSSSRSIFYTILSGSLSSTCFWLFVVFGEINGC